MGHALRLKLSPSTLAAASLIVALVFSALNAITLAGYALVVASAFVALGSVAAAYRALPAGEQQLVISRSVVKSSAITALLFAIAVSCSYWYLGWMTYKWLPLAVQQFMVRHWRKLDFIPSAFSLLLPHGWRSGFHQYFNDITYCFPGSYSWESMRYLRTAIPGYTLAIFSGLLFLRLLWPTIRRFVGPA